MLSLRGSDRPTRSTGPVTFPPFHVNLGLDPSEPSLPAFGDAALLCRFPVPAPYVVHDAGVNLVDGGQLVILWILEALCMVRGHGYRYSVRIALSDGGTVLVDEADFNPQTILWGNKNERVGLAAGDQREDPESGPF